MFNNILVVCVGNICRSPTAERLLQRYHPELKVESAGLGALVGKGADPTAISIAAEHQPQPVSQLRPDFDHGKAPYRTLMRDGT